MLGYFRASLGDSVLRFDGLNIEAAFMSELFGAQGCVGAERLCVTLSEQVWTTGMLDARLQGKIVGRWTKATLKLRAYAKLNTRAEMFSVVGLTLDDVSSGALPHVRLGKTLDERKTKSNFRFAEIVVVYTTVETDTQGPAARTKYRHLGQFLVFLYFNDAAVEACKEIGIPIRVLERIEESELPSRRTTVLERPYLAPASK